MLRPIGTFSLVAIGVGTLLLVVADRASRERQSQVREVVVVVESIDFGIAWRQPQFPWKVTLQNTSAKTVELSDVETSCACTTTSQLAGTIEPGESKNIEFILDLTKAEMQGDRGEFAVNLTFRFAGDVPPVSSVLRGVVITCPFQIDGQDLDLGTIVFGTGQPTEREFDIECPPGLDLRAEPVEGVPGVDVEVTARDSSQHVAINIAEDVPLGPFDFTIDLVADSGPGEPSLLRLPILGEVVVDAESIPAQIILGAKPVGETFDESFSICSRSGRWIESVEVVSVPEGFAVETIPPTDLPGPRAYVRVTGPIADAGAQSYGIRLAVANSDGADCTIDVPVQYYGFASDLPREEVEACQ